MEILDLIFALVQAYVPIPEHKYRSLYAEATDWRAGLDSPNKTDADFNPVEKVYRKVHKPWPMRLIIACLYIPIFRWLNAPESNERDED